MITGEEPRYIVLYEGNVDKWCGATHPFAQYLAICTPLAPKSYKQMHTVTLMAALLLLTLFHPTIARD
jgi:hypothetical protein